MEVPLVRLLEEGLHAWREARQLHGHQARAILHGDVGARVEEQPHHSQAGARRRVQGRIAYAIYRIDMGARVKELFYASTGAMRHAPLGDGDVERRPPQQPTRLHPTY